MVPSYWRLGTSLLGILLLVVLIWGIGQRNACTRLQYQYNALGGEAQTAQSNLATAQDEVKRLKEACEIKDRALADLRTEVATAEAKAASCDRAADELHAKLDRLKEEASKELVAALDQAKARHEALLADQHKAEQDLQDEIARQGKSAGDLAEAQQEAGRQIAALNQQLLQVQTDLKAAEANAASLRDQSTAQVKEIHDKDQEIARLKELGTKVWDDLTAAKKQNDALSKEIAKQKKDLDSLRDDLARARRKK